MGSEKKLRWLPPTLSLVLCLLLFRMPQVCTAGVKAGINLCANVVIPSLFLFLVLANFWVTSGFVEMLSKGLAPLTRLLFRLPGSCAGVLFLGMIGGYPVGISMTATLFRQHRITKNEAQRLCSFAFNAGPAFVVFAVGDAMLHSFRAGVLLYASVVLSALLLGIVSGFFAEKEVKASASPSPSDIFYGLPLSRAVPEAVSKATHTMLFICAWVVLFYALTACLQGLPLSKGSLLFLNCVLEVTVGLKSAAGQFPLPVLAAILSFGGLSVHCQILEDLQTCGVKFLHFLVSRGVCGVFSACICAVLLKFFPCEISVFASTADVIPAPYSVSAPAFVALLFMSILFILELDSKREMC